MINKLFELRSVAAIFNLDPSRLRYWIQSGVLTPSTRRGGKYYYSFVDLIQVRTRYQERMPLGETQFAALHLEQCLILFDQSVSRLGQYSYETFLVQRGKSARHRQAPH